MAKQVKRVQKTHTFSKLVVGETYTGKNGERFKVLSHYRDAYYLAQFIETGNLQYISARKIPEIYDCSKPYVLGVGYFKCTSDPIMRFDGLAKHFHQCWIGMITRCHKGGKQYNAWKTTTICDEWYNFANFYRWAAEQPFVPDCRWNLDKDLFAYPDRKIYSPDTCCFLPSGLNASLCNLSYDEIHNPKPSNNMRIRCQSLSRKLLFYDGQLPERVLNVLWNICTVNGFSKDYVLLREKYSQMKERMAKAEQDIENLKTVKNAYEQKDIDSRHWLTLYPTMPLKGYIELQGKIYRIDTAKDLYAMLNMARQAMQNAPRP